ncbi:unnamed protein product [Arabidopsis lyrata]|nr:unnamed protein product [Arabidopsis lyrata]
MGDSFPIDLTLPKLLYNIGHEPNSDVRINQCARYEYIDKVQRILSATEFQRIGYFSKLRDIDSEDIRNKLAMDIFNECDKIS